MGADWGPPGQGPVPDWVDRIAELFGNIQHALTVLDRVMSDNPSERTRQAFWIQDLVNRFGMPVIVALIALAEKLRGDAEEDGTDKALLKALGEVFAARQLRDPAAVAGAKANLLTQVHAALDQAETGE